MKIFGILTPIWTAVIFLLVAGEADKKTTIIGIAITAIFSVLIVLGLYATNQID